MKALVRTIIAVAVFLIVVLPACNKIRSALGSDTKSFEEFVDGINEMPSGSMEPFLLKLNDRSAIVGFDKDVDSFQCCSCGGTTGINRITQKPEDDDACDGTACICLCNGEFENKPNILGSVWRGECKGDWICRALENIEIADRTIIEKRSPLFGNDIYPYWIDSFLFSRGIQYANGFATNHDELITLYVEKKVEGGKNIIGVCNKEILDFNEEQFTYLPEGTCISPTIPIPQCS